MMMFCNDYYADKEFIDKLPLLFELTEGSNNFFHKSKGKSPKDVSFDLTNFNLNRPCMFAHNYALSSSES